MLSNLLSKLRDMVALDSPSSFFAVTLYLPASSTVTFFISKLAKYECPSLSTTSWKAHLFINYLERYFANNVVNSIIISQLR